MPRSAKRHRSKSWRPPLFGRRSRQKRGYDAAWMRLRKKKLQKNPLCEHCSKRDKWVEATEVDHIVPFKGIDDPLRLDYDNLQSLCGTCHRRKTAKQGKRQ